MAISKEFLEILACSQYKQAVELRSDGQALLCRQRRLAYPVREDIPVRRSAEN
ncbi:MAG: Trm112 family protein [Geoalkalibacter sp.]|jgi:uncharacterized protein YbaR (Trm112 family)|uniref:Trm112 family protein n=1 Tax=Geoalkalibacter sp. TaxID=3041440 RepID=UPI002A9E2911|nr:Trm112 family protein [Thermodesulfobacteriota bacterium]